MAIELYKGDYIATARLSILISVLLMLLSGLVVWVNFRPAACARTLNLLVAKRTSSGSSTLLNYGAAPGQLSISVGFAVPLLTKIFTIFIFCWKNSHCGNAPSSVEAYVSKMIHNAHWVSLPPMASDKLSCLSRTALIQLRVSMQCQTTIPSQAAHPDTTCCHTSLHVKASPEAQDA